MPRTSPVHYIAPSAISIMPNANDSANDLAVYIARGAVIKVCCNAIPELAPQDGNYREWTLSGRNRRLANSDVPYTIYARLSKSSTDAYLIFVPQSWRHTKYADKYPYVTVGGLSTLEDSPSSDVINMMRDYWFIRLGDVSLPEDNLRTVSLDTGILGTDQYNEEWVLNPDAMPLRVEIANSKTASVPYVAWGESLDVEAKIVEGWNGEVEEERVQRWSIRRDSGDAAADATWNGGDSQDSGQTMANGSFTLMHSHDGSDDFGGAPSVAFVVTAWGVGEEDESVVALASATITVLAETLEKYGLALSTHLVSFNPVTRQYSPSAGVDVRIRSIAQDGSVSYLTQERFDAAQLVVLCAPAGDSSPSSETELELAGEPSSVAVGNIPASAFSAQQSLDVRLRNTAGIELSAVSIAFVRDGEDSKEREWIYRLNSSAGYDSTVANRGKQFQDDDFVPTGWTDDPVGVSTEGDVEYASWRDFDKASGRWGGFHAPVIWIRYGNDGADGVTYSLKPSLSQISVARTESGGYTPSNVVLTCGCVKSEGGDFTTIEDATGLIDGKYYVFYRLRSRATREWSAGYFRYGYAEYYNVLVSTGVDVAACDAVEFILCANSSDSIASGSSVTELIDRETVSVVSDGRKGDDGNDGQDAVVMSANPPAVSFVCDSSGKSIDVNVKEVGLTMYKGQNSVGFSATVKNTVNCAAWVSGKNVFITTGGAWQNGTSVVYTDKPYPYVEVGENVYGSSGQIIGTVADKGTVYITVGDSATRYTGLAGQSFRSLSNGGSVTVTGVNSGISRDITIPVIANIRGNDGTPGPPGSAGPMLYPAGVWEEKAYEANGDSRPYVYYAPDGNYYYLNADSATSEDVPGSSDKWTLMTQVDVVYAKFGIIDYGQMASSVFCGDWMYSQYGKLYTGSDTYVTIDDSNYDTAFTFGDASAVPFGWFSPDYPQGGRTGTFAPNWSVNLLTGESCQCGPMFIGDTSAYGVSDDQRVGKNFLEYTPSNGLKIQGDVILSSGQSVKDAIEDAERKIEEATGKKFNIWFSDTDDPTQDATPYPNADDKTHTANEPASEWDTDAKKEEHLQDLYFDRTKIPGTAGRNWRWVKEDENGVTTYFWENVTDKETLKALELIGVANARLDVLADSIEAAVTLDRLVASGFRLGTDGMLIEGNKLEIAADTILESVLTEASDEVPFDSTASTIIKTEKFTESTIVPGYPRRDPMRSLVVNALNEPKVYSTGVSGDSHLVCLPFYDENVNLWISQTDIHTYSDGRFSLAAGSGSSYDYTNYIGRLIDQWQRGGTLLSITNESDMFINNYEAILDKESSWWNNGIQTSESKEIVSMLMDRVVLVCSDPRLVCYDNVNTADETKQLVKMGYNDGQSYLWQPGRFSCGGYVSRFIALLPGQTLQLRSQILDVATSEIDEDTGEYVRRKVLTWVVVNASDFVSIDRAVLVDGSLEIGYNPVGIDFANSGGAGLRTEIECVLGNRVLALDDAQTTRMRFNVTVNS